MANLLLNTKLPILSTLILKCSTTTNSFLFRTFCSTKPTFENQKNVRKMEVFSLEV